MKNYERESILTQLHSILMDMERGGVSLPIEQARAFGSLLRWLDEEAM